VAGLDSSILSPFSEIMSEFHDHEFVPSTSSPMAPSQKSIIELQLKHWLWIQQNMPMLPKRRYKSLSSFFVSILQHFPFLALHWVTYKAFNITLIERMPCLCTNTLIAKAQKSYSLITAHAQDEDHPIQ